MATFAATSATVACFVTLTPTAFAQARASHVDDFSGFSVTAPRGWRLLRDGEFALPKGAQAGFVDARGEVIVYILIDLIPGGVIPQDERALDLYVERVTTKPGGTGGFTRPTPCLVAGRRALRTSTSISSGGLTILNTGTYTREGYLYFLVGSFAETRHRPQAAAAHEAFERAVTISKTSDDLLASLERPIAASIPYLDAAGVRLLTRAVFDRASSYDTVETMTVGYTIVSRGLELLPAADLATVDALHAKALATLPEEERAFLARVNADIVAGKEVSREDQEHSFRTFRRAYATLNPSELATLGRLARIYIRLGMAAYDEEH